MRSFSSRSRRASYSSSVSCRGILSSLFELSASFGREVEGEREWCLCLRDFFLSLCFWCLDRFLCRLWSSGSLADAERDLLLERDEMSEREDELCRCFLRRLRPLSSSSPLSPEALTAAVNRTLLGCQFSELCRLTAWLPLRRRFAQLKFTAVDYHNRHSRSILFVGRHLCYFLYNVIKTTDYTPKDDVLSLHETSLATIV